MTEQGHHILALAIYFVAMLGIGWYAYRRTTNHSDYLLGGRELRPTTAALSAGASDMSGWLMMGLPGAIYVSGLVESWIAIGLLIGAYLNWRLVAPRLRAATEVAGDALTIPSFLERRLRDRTHLIRVVSGLVILVFFTLYISSGMVAGGVFVENSFGGEYLTGMLLVAGVTLVYTMFGGFLGASLTDVVQGLMMMAALLLVPVMAVWQLGGPGEAISAVRELDPDHLSMLAGTALTGGGLTAIVSALAWGLGYFGQPHVIVRFMAMRDAGGAKAARRIGITWMGLSLLGAVAGGLVGVAYIARTGTTLNDPEAVMLVMSQLLLHPLVGGFVLAAVVAAVMSTVSSQLIVCSSALVEDLYRIGRRTPPSQRTLVLLGRACVLVVAVIAVLLALTPGGTILSLVAFAWAGFGASFGPAILLSLFWRRLTAAGTLAGMTVGAVTVFGWKALDTGLYELLPAFVAHLVVAVVVSLLWPKPDPEIDREFTASVALAEGRAVDDDPDPVSASAA
ncbi:sodium/proline symporter PutP [Cellulomonas denverensis]|uniref:Sodium/proline symporter n=1 Tax=Cellulomonas denverensis TaxID=264297 RepID=A0A7X6KU63_9CELL|nr:sodium/proline symporter PutP [Cellulomonas denverensis]NKY22140.1 sodium/proline symporter PutP [Cellulomonas denverensis]GIG26099.1 sodium:proline symporter [Cellulomonas denverensis]